MPPGLVSLTLLFPVQNTGKRTDSLYSENPRKGNVRAAKPLQLLVILFREAVILPAVKHHPQDAVQTKQWVRGYRPYRCHRRKCPVGPHSCKHSCICDPRPSLSCSVSGEIPVAMLRFVSYSNDIESHPWKASMTCGLCM